MMFFVVSILVVFSLLWAYPQKKDVKTQVIKNGIDIVLVLDLSYSMVAEDIAPNRLEVAKQALSDFTSKLKTDRVGLILFSGKPFTSVPLTFDYDFITQYVKNITIHNINQDFTHLQGTAIWDALLYGAHLFEEGNQREKVMVLFTDGEANKWIDPIEALRYIKQKNIKIHTVWIGGDEDTYVTVRNIYGTQKIAIWWIDEKNLQTIAALTQWYYYKANNKKAFEEIFAHLDLLPKSDISIEKIELYTPYHRVFIYILFLLMLLFVWYNYYFYLRK